MLPLRKNFRQFFTGGRVFFAKLSFALSKESGLKSKSTFQDSNILDGSGKIYLYNFNSSPLTVEDLQKISLSLPGVTEDIKWESHLCFSIGGKMFLVTSPDLVPSSASFKVSAEDFHEFISREGFEKHAYLGRHNWIRLDDINRIASKEWETCIRESYNLVSAKLSLKKRKILGII